MAEFVADEAPHGHVVWQDHEYAGFHYVIFCDSQTGATTAVPHKGQHPAASKEKHLRAAVETYQQDFA
jgi:hypothetical protein